MKYGNEMALWESWKQGGERPSDLEPLMRELDPLINSQVSVYSGKVNIPPDAIQAKAEDLVVTALQSYSAGKGAKLATHVFNHLRGLNRFATKYQNPARIPQHQTHKIRELMETRDRMTAQLGRPPTDYALAKKMRWSPRQVARLQTGLRRKALDPELFKTRDPRRYQTSRFQEVMQFLPRQLGPNEQFVFQRTYGLEGTKPLSVSQMAKKLRTSPATVSRIRRNIADTIAQHMDVR